VAKKLATDWKVVVGSTALSGWAFNVDIADEKERVEVSGFSPLGAREYLPGLADQAVEVSFRMDYASGGPHQTIYPLYSGGSVFKFWVQPDSDAGTSSTNPWYGGTASVFSYPVGAALNEAEEITVTFSPAPSSSFVWGTAVAGP
jgi:hypothetical protein